MVDAEPWSDLLLVRSAVPKNLSRGARGAATREVLSLWGFRCGGFVHQLTAVFGTYQIGEG